MSKTPMEPAGHDRELAEPIEPIDPTGKVGQMNHEPAPMTNRFRERPSSQTIGRMFLEELRIAGSPVVALVQGRPQRRPMAIIEHCVRDERCTKPCELNPPAEVHVFCPRGTKRIVETVHVLERLAGHRQRATHRKREKAMQDRQRIFGNKPTISQNTDLIESPGEQIGIAAGIEQCLQIPGPHSIIGIEESDQTARRRGDARVPASGYSPALDVDDMEPRKSISETHRHRCRIVGRTIIRDDHLPLTRQRLCCEGRQLSADGCGAVANRNDHRKIHLGSQPTGRTAGRLSKGASR